jgi:hypothetical protein
VTARLSLSDLEMHQRKFKIYLLEIIVHFNEHGVVSVAVDDDDGGDGDNNNNFYITFTVVSNIKYCFE